MSRSRSALLPAVLLLGAVGPAPAVCPPDCVAGGGAKSLDCVTVFDAPGANTPAPPRAPRNVDCVDGDPSCDTDGQRNAQCAFALRLCINSTAVPECTPDRTDSVTVAHALDNGDPRFDTDFQALQQRANLLGFPDNTSHACTISSTITVALRPPRDEGGGFKKNEKRLRVTATGFTDRPAEDLDRMRFICRPEGDGLYAPRELYTGTFDRIRQEVFARSCALSGCHDSESHTGNMILLPNAAYSETVGVDADNAAAHADGLKRIDPGNPQNSLLFLKVDAKTHGTPLPSGYGEPMPRIGQPLSAHLVDIIELWIVGDMTLGPAPQDGWVEGTDQ